MSKSFIFSGSASSLCTQTQIKWSCSHHLSEECASTPIHQQLDLNRHNCGSLQAPESLQGNSTLPGKSASMLVSMHACKYRTTRRFALMYVYKAPTQPVVPSRDPTCPALLSGLCDVCGLDRAFQHVHCQPGRKRGIWHVSTGIPVTWEMCPTGT